MDARNPYARPAARIPSKPAPPLGLVGGCVVALVLAFAGMMLWSAATLLSGASVDSVRLLAQGTGMMFLVPQALLLLLGGLLMRRKARAAAVCLVISAALGMAPLVQLGYWSPVIVALAAAAYARRRHRAHPFGSA